jgi:alpha,alpha-trehalose phosphorylase (configuration-retaining)
LVRYNTKSSCLWTYNARYVPKPKPGVFRITKNVHNILQGVAKPDERISANQKESITDWIKDNATRYWLSEGGPLRDPAEGGADVIIVRFLCLFRNRLLTLIAQIDDPQMPSLIPLAKKASPNRPVLYRSHIEIRSDLAAQEGSPQADVWQFLWNNIQHADMFISHPMPSFVPKNVPRSKVAYLPATTDW